MNYRKMFRALATLVFFIGVIALIINATGVMLPTQETPTELSTPVRGKFSRTLPAEILLPSTTIPRSSLDPGGNGSIYRIDPAEAPTPPPKNR